MLSFTSIAVPDLILMKNWPFFSTRSSALPACPVIENSCSKPSSLCKFSVSTQTFPKNGRLGPYFIISTCGDIRTAAIIEEFTLAS